MAADAYVHLMDGTPYPGPIPKRLEVPVSTFDGDLVTLEVVAAEPGDADYEDVLEAWMYERGYVRVEAKQPAVSRESAEGHWFLEYGTAASGNFGHAGIPGHQGGSAPTGGRAVGGRAKGGRARAPRKAPAKAAAAAPEAPVVAAPKTGAPTQGEASLEGRPAWLDTGPRLQASMEGGPQKTKKFDATHVFTTNLETYADGTRAVVKPESTARGMHADPRAEVAAYELDRVLGLNMVPATVFCERDGGTCSAQRWVENSTVAAESNDRQGDAAMIKMNAFDVLIGNGDRHPGNYLRTPEHTTVLIDHGLAFQTVFQGRVDPRRLGEATRKIADRHVKGTPAEKGHEAFINRLATVPDAELVAAMKRGGYAEDSPQTKSMLDRRTAYVKAYKGGGQTMKLQRVAR